MNYKFTTPENRAVFIIEDDNSCKTSLLVTGVDPANTDYANFKKQILADEAQLQDSEGVTMSAAEAKAYIAALP